MAVVKQTINYAVFDELLYYNSIYASCSPFRMDSEVRALIRDGLSRKRKRRVKKVISGEWLEICNRVKERYEEARNDVNSFQKNISIDLRNAAAKKSASVADGVLLENLGFYIASYAVSSMCEVVLDKSTNTMQKETLECTLWNNPNSKSVFLVSGSEEFIIPPECAFVVGDVRLSRHLLFRGLKFDLIVLDPPWNNKSVRRRSVYDIFNEEVLFDLPLPELLCVNGIVALWLTNNSHVHSVAEQFLVHYSLRKLAVWYWLKVTQLGEAVCKFRPEHKVPFESIIIACEETAIHSRDNFLDGYVLISTPSAIHSRKPPIAKLLSSLNVFSPEKTLELFGRYLLPLTTTVGFEAVKLQNTRFFKRINKLK